MSIVSRSAVRGLLALPAALLIAAGPAIAEPQQGETVITATSGQDTVIRSTKVVYRDLDLTTAHGQHQLAQRLASAADAVCANAPDQLWNKFDGINYRHCYKDAVAAAAAHLPAAAVAAAD